MPERHPLPAGGPLDIVYGGSGCSDERLVVLRAGDDVLTEQGQSVAVRGGSNN